MSRPKILIVEDESISAVDLSQRLEYLGYDVNDVAASGESAIKKVKDHLPNLILMDIKLQGRMNGVETAELIRQQHDIPIIYVTAYADQNTLERVKHTEPYGFILKPYEDNELKGVIETALHKHSMEKKLKQINL